MTLPSSLFVIGDVHGCAQELKTLLNKLPLIPSSTVVMVGDYIDRGPDSRGVIETILKLKKYCNVVALTGNHEAMLQEFLVDPTSHAAGMFIYNGGGATLASYSKGDGTYQIPEEHLRFFDELKLCFQTPEFFFVHAGVPDVPLAQINEDEDRDEMLWVRRTFHNSTFSWEKLIVHGHSPVPEVFFGERRINVDTGCVFKQHLTALELPSRQVYSVAKSQEARHVHLRDLSSNRIATRYKGAVPVYVHIGQETVEFETIDYNEFGMLMREIVERPDEVMAVNDLISGHIGSNDATLVAFRARVIRTQQHELGRSFAIRLEALTQRAE